MNVETITMDRDEAREKLAEYREWLTRRDDAEYERLVDAYAALARGTPLLSLSNVIAHAPRDEKLRPRLAIARADRRQVTYQRWGGGTEIFTTPKSRYGRSPNDSRIEIPVIPGVTPQGVESPIEGYALVPIVPPVVRQDRALHNYLILWEVERWADRPRSSTPDRDPYLLRRIGDDLFAVIEEWDLTPIERAVMADRRQDP